MKPSSGLFAAGTIIRLYVVDEDYLVDHILLASDGTLRFADIPPGHGSLFLVGSVRSSAAGFPYAQAHKGDRMYHHFNDDGSERYRFQRLTGEGTRHPNQVIARIQNRAHWLVERVGKRKAEIALRKPSSCIQDQSGIEKRFAWVPNAEADVDLFGVHSVFYPEYSNEGIYKAWMSFHGAKENVWNPVASEAGYWAEREPLTGLLVYPRGGPAVRKADAVAGSCESLYRTKGRKSRVLVPTGGLDSLTLPVCPEGHNLRILVVGRSRASETHDGLLVALNGDAKDHNYGCQRMIGSAGGRKGELAEDREFGVVPGGSSNPGSYGVSLMCIANCSAQDRQKQISSTSGGLDDFIGIYGGRWKSNAPITSVTVTLRSGMSFEAGSVFEVWVNEDVPTSAIGRGSDPPRATPEPSPSETC